MKYCIILILLSFLLIQPAFSQRKEEYKKIEVWGINKKAKEAFTKKMEKMFPGQGLKAACMSVLKRDFRFKTPFVSIFPNDSNKDDFYLLISLRDIPKSKFSVPKNKLKNIPAPVEWEKLLSLDSAKEDLISIELQLLPMYFFDYLQNDSNYIKEKVEKYNSQGDDSLEIDKILYMLKTLSSLHNFDQQQVKQILKYSKDRKLREAAVLVMMNWLDDEDIMECVLESMLDYDLMSYPVNVVNCYINSRCSESKKNQFDVTSHVDLLHVLLNYPNPGDVKTIIKLINCSEKSEYLKYRRTDLFTKKMPTLEDMLNSDIPMYPKLAIDFLRRFSDGDYGTDKDKWLVWLRSFYRK
ncbi:MAG: hypothetical protein ABSG15_02175 [FCB group bacterium]|jgi:hypothetical protein